MKGDFTVERPTRGTHLVRVPWETGDSWEFWTLLRSDAHHDNVHCDQTLERRHLEQAIERKAAIIDYGDLYCLMQGKWDKRADRNQLRSEHAGNDYLGLVHHTSVPFYQPFAENIVLLSPGNHEGAVLERHGIDMTQLLCDALGVSKGGYSGYVRFQFSAGSRHTTSKVLWYHHGYGGGGPVTKGIIQTNRRQFVSDADIICTGHVHEKWAIEIPRQRLNMATNQSECIPQWHICTPGYKDEYEDGHGGWHISRGAPPKPKGAAWVRFYNGEHGLEYDVRLTGNN